MQMREDERLDLSIVMPCRNEAAAVGICVDAADTFLKNNRLCGEILVVDNGSADGSSLLAARHGARVIKEERPGYGNAVRTGIAHSRGTWIIIGDCDTTYDFLYLEGMYEMLSSGGYDMVIGNRYAGGMEPGSMPWTHRWGVRFLSFCARLRFGTEVYDFHCGLRGLSRKAASQLEFHTEGMEFATEMIAEAARHALCIGQIPVPLKKCRYERTSKLRTIRDGCRHLTYILTNRRIRM